MNTDGVKILIHINDLCASAALGELLGRRDNGDILTAIPDSIGDQAVFAIVDKGESLAGVKAKCPQAVFFVIGEEDGTGPLSEVPEQDRFTFPFRAGSLLSRIKRHLTYRKQSAGLEKVIRLGRYDFHHADGLLMSEGSDPVRLTDKERDILLALYRKDGQEMERKALLESVWGYVEGVETHTLETHIYRLRQKIEKDPSVPEILCTGDTGYFLRL